MKKSAYERSSGRAVDESSSSLSKSAHLSSSRDPFKPRQTDWIIALICPWAVYSYCWKRAGLPLSSLFEYAWLYTITGLCYVVCTLPWCMVNNEAESGNVPWDNREPYYESLYRTWPWYKYVRFLYLLPYLLQVVLALKAWYRARKVTYLAVERAELRDVDLAKFDVDRQFWEFGTNFPFAGFLNDLFGMRITSSELDLQTLLQPPTVSDVGTEEELEEVLFPLFLPLMACWYGPIRFVNICMGLLLGFLYHFLADLLTLLFGWLVAFVYLWTKNGRPDFRSLMSYFRGVFFGGLWSCLYSVIPFAATLGMAVMCYRASKQFGVSVQLKRVSK